MNITSNTSIQLIVVELAFFVKSSIFHVGYSGVDRQPSNQKSMASCSAALNIHVARQVRKS